MLVLNIGASLLAFYSFIKFLDAVVMWFGHFAGSDELSFSYILGYIMYPVAFLIGIDPQVAMITFDISRDIALRSYLNTTVKFR